MIVVGQVLADTSGWGHMTGWGWGWMGLMWLFWAALIGLVVWLVARSSDRSPKRPSPDEVLEERFARGEMSLEEFEERRDALRR